MALDIAEEQPEGIIFLIPSRLEACEILESPARWHWVDLFRSDGYGRLLKSLSAPAKVLQTSNSTSKEEVEAARDLDIVALETVKDNTKLLYPGPVSGRLVRSADPISASK